MNSILYTFMRAPSESVTESHHQGQAQAQADEESSAPGGWGDKMASLYNPDELKAQTDSPRLHS